MSKKDDYQSLNKELDEIMDKLQGDELSIDTAVTYYERGMEIVQLMESQLKEAENKVTKIKADWESKTAR